MAVVLQQAVLNFGQFGTAGTTKSGTFTNPVVAGDTIIGLLISNAVPTSIQAGATNLITDLSFNSPFGFITIARLSNAPAGSTTITYTLPGTSSNTEMICYDFSGLVTSSPLDATTTASGVAGTNPTASITTIYPSDLIIAVIGEGTVAGAGFTGYVTTWGSITEYETVGSAGTYTVNGTATLNWSLGAAAYKIAGINQVGFDALAPHSAVTASSRINRRGTESVGGRSAATLTAKGLMAGRVTI